MTKLMERVFYIISIATSIKVNLSKITWMDLEFFIISMAIDMKENSKKIKEKEKEYIIISKQELDG